jgi:mono/diheme cytochrome c family protein
MRSLLLFSVAILFVNAFLAVPMRAAPAESTESAPVFEKQIQRILNSRCGKCHSSKARKGSLDLSSMAGVKKGGESGEPAVVKSLDESLLWIMIDGGDMPPKGQPRLKANEKELIRKWILGGAKSAAGSDVRVTQHEVFPYLYTRCVVCHGVRKQESGLDLRTAASMLKGGKSGPAIVPGKPGESLMLKKIHARDMPPPKELIRAGVRPMEAPEIALLTKWIEQGAVEYDIRPNVQTTEPDPLVSDEDRNFWAFQTPQKPSVPAGAVSPIDAFILRKLRENKLTPSPQAEKLVLIRRAAFDLTGLPPEWKDVERFLADDSADWFTKIVDFYLDSPHYGERWGRYWLDLAGYADSEGKRSADPIRPHAWRFRDYVVRSLNDDKPYDRFLLEQLAGDELYDFKNAGIIDDDMGDALVATGFLRMAPDGTGSDIVNSVAERFEVVADEIETLGSGVLGLTLKCAQCHTHKYDPIPQRDYYRLVAVFQGAYDVYDWMKPVSVPGQSKSGDERRYLTYVSERTMAEFEARVTAFQPRIKAVQQKYDDLEAEYRSKFLDEQLKEVPDEIRADVKAAALADEKKRSEVQKYLVKKFAKRVTVKAADLRKKYADLKKAKTERDKTLADLESKVGPEPVVRALWDRGQPSPTWIFRRGEFTNPGDYVGPGVPSVLTDGKTPLEVKSPFEGSTGRRLAFAKWLTDPQHPLTARVFVNRVWYHHFGRGIVESLANFGRTGTPPTHPELLDWLAVSFMENGWSLKSLHRQIMTSSTYRQAALLRDESAEHDADNRWLSRMSMRRLEAESVRDTLLAVAGKLDRKAFGNPDLVDVRADGLVTAKPTEAGWRRTIYVQQRRKEIPTILEAFDLPQMNPNCIERPNSTVASQALHLLNNQMIRDLSIEFAKRVEKEVGNDRYRQVERTYQIALSRGPSNNEKLLALESIEKLTAAWKKQPADPKSDDNVKPETRALAAFCHVVMNSAGFVFVD